MSKILFLNPYYYPGFRSGGPQRTVMNIADAFGDKNDIYILTQNRDMGCTDSYDVETHKWIRVGNANVMYLPPKDYNIKSIKKYSADFDTVYSCGLFCGCTINAILLHKFNKSQKLYVAPMGVFSKAAIASKAFKKRAFLFVFKSLGLFKNIVWSFTSEIEREEAKAALGSTIKEYIIAEDLPRKVDFDAQIAKIQTCAAKENDVLKLVFLSRVSPKKNLEYCAQILNKITDKEIIFDVYGTAENEEYWDRCRKLLESLPKNIHYRYCGEVNSEKVIDVFSNYDAFFFPTKGENFGHVIYEALAAGCVPIISDRTPWLDLGENDCGYVLPLENPDAFVETIRELTDVKAGSKLGKMNINAVEYARRKYEKSVGKSGYKKVFK